jgi:hypothetical protein
VKGKPRVLEVIAKGKDWNTYQNTRRSEDHIRYDERYSVHSIIWYIVTKLTSNLALVAECMLFNEERICSQLTRRFQATVSSLTCTGRASDPRTNGMLNVIITPFVWWVSGFFPRPSYSY